MESVELPLEASKILPCPHRQSLQESLCQSLGRDLVCPHHFYAPAIRRMVEGHLVLPPSVRASVRPSIIKIWCPLNNFWKTASIQFKFGMLIYNIKTQVKSDLGYNPLIFDRVMGLL